MDKSKKPVTKKPSKPIVNKSPEKQKASVSPTAKLPKAEAAKAAMAKEIGKVPLAKALAKAEAEAGLPPRKVPKPKDTELHVDGKGKPENPAPADPPAPEGVHKKTTIARGDKVTITYTHSAPIVDTSNKGEVVVWLK